MNALDAGIVLAFAAAALGGWRRGLIVRLAATAGGTVGVLIAARRVDVLAAGSDPASVQRLGKVLAGLVFAWLLGRIAGELAGRQLRGLLPHPLRRVDRALGLAVGCAGVLVTVWLAAPVLQLLPGRPSELADGSGLVSVIKSSVGLAPLPVDPTKWAPAKPGS